MDSALTPRINLSPRRCRRRHISLLDYAINVVMAFVYIPVMLGMVVYYIGLLMYSTWCDLSDELRVTYAAWRELDELAEFLERHAGGTLKKLTAGSWSWQDDATELELVWQPPSAWGQPSTFELTARGPIQLMTLRLDDRNGPTMRSDLDDREQMERWAAETGARIVSHLTDLTGAIPDVKVAGSEARVRLPLVGPLKPLLGAAEALLSAVPHWRVPDRTQPRLPG